MDQSANYVFVKEAVLKGYELVAEAYWQKFRNSTKQDKQTYVELTQNNFCLIGGEY